MTEFEHTELKPCPFCGGEAEVSLLLGNYGVTCTECMGAIFPAKGMTKEEAIKQWNTRKPMDKILKQLEKWKQEADEQYEDTDSELYKMASVGKYHAYKQAIEIVENGGKNE